MAKITVEVTKEDIESGEIRSCLCCPLSIAISRATGLETWVWGSKFRIGGLFFWHPPRARSFLRSFDSNVVVNPFSFTLDLPDSVLSDAVTSPSLTNSN